MPEPALPDLRCPSCDAGRSEKSWSALGSDRQFTFKCTNGHPVTITLTVEQEELAYRLRARPQDRVLEPFKVVFVGEGDLEDRDGYGIRVRVLRKDRSIGIALGIIDGPTLALLRPEEPDDLNRYQRGAIRVLCEQIEAQVRAGTFGASWQLEARVFPLEHAVISSRARVSETSSPLRDETIWEFQTPVIELGMVERTA